MGLDHGIQVRGRVDSEIYWRKCNQIRGWFSRLENFEDNGITEISAEILSDLYQDLCEVSKDHSKAEEILPVQKGFFFGSYEYDEYYFDQIDEAIEQIEDFLSNLEEDADIVYWEWY